MRNCGWRSGGVWEWEGQQADGAAATSQASPWRLALPGPAWSRLSWLLLVLAFGSCVEILQHTLDVLEGGPLLRAVLPAARHDVIQLLWAVLRPRHPVSTFQCPDHLRVCHP